MAQTSPNLVDTSSIYLKTALFSGTNAFPAAYLDALSATSEKRILIQSMRLCNKSASPIDMEIRVYVTSYSSTFPNPPGGGSGGGGFTIKLIDDVTVPALSTMVLQSNDLNQLIARNDTTETGVYANYGLDGLTTSLTQNYEVAIYTFSSDIDVVISYAELDD